MTRTRAIAAVVTALLSASAACSSDDDNGGAGASAINPVGGAGGIGGGAGGIGGGASGGVGGAPIGGAAGTIAGTGGMTGGVGGGGGAAGTIAGAGGMTGGTGGMTGGEGGMTGGMGGAGGESGTGGPGELPVCEPGPDEFEANGTPGGGGGSYKDSPHFRIYGASDAVADAAINELEAAYTCFVNTLCWRSSGLSIHDDSDSGPYYKMNIYSVGSLGGAGGQMFSDAGEGLSYLKVVSAYVSDPKVTVHEYGHALTYHEEGWVEQTRTGAWWETVANFVADTYMTSPLCEGARNQFGEPEGDTIIDLNKVLGSSYQVIVDGSQGSGNYYQAWPFLTYLTNNPDGYEGLGPTCLRDMFRQHMGNNETPLHVLERVASPVSVQQIVGRYWAHMAYVDIGHEQAHEAFESQRGSINFANLDASGGGNYRVKSARQPRYMGANIIPLSGTGMISVQVTSDDPFTATLAVQGSSSVRYVDLPGGSGEAMVAADEEASLVVANTPDALIQYDPFSISGDVAAGLDYEVSLTGATPAD